MRLFLRFWTKAQNCCILTIFVAPACAGVGAVTVVETLHLGDVQGGEDGVTGEGHAGVHRGHHPLGGVDSETKCAINVLDTLTESGANAKLRSLSAF